jgi:hypothetical protein
MRPFQSATLASSTRNFIYFITAIMLMLPALCFAAPANSAYLYVGWDIGQWPHITEHISGFSVAADGSLQTLAGFPVTGPSFGLVAVRNFIFGDDALHQLASYTRGDDGSLRETSRVDEYQYAPQGQGMTVYALNPDRAGLALNTVISCGSCNSYVLPFAIQSDGKLSFIGGPATPPISQAKWDGIFFFSPDNNYAYTDDWGGFDTLKRNPNGSLTWLYGWPLPAPPPPQNQVCIPADVASSSSGFVAMSWYGSQYWCDNDGYLMGTYTVGTNGFLELVSGTGFTPQVLEDSMVFDPTGKYLAMAGCTGQYDCTGSSAAMQIYELQSDGTLTAVGNIQTTNTTDTFVSVQWDTANHLYVLGDAECNGGLYPACTSDLYIYNFDGQNLTLAPGSPHTLTNVAGLAVSPLS